MSRKALEQLNIAAMAICFCCVGLFLGFTVAAVAYRSWAVLAVAITFLLVGYLLTYVGEYCHHKLHH